MKNEIIIEKIKEQLEDAYEERYNLEDKLYYSSNKINKNKEKTLSIRLCQVENKISDLERQLSRLEKAVY